MNTQESMGNSDKGKLVMVVIGGLLAAGVLGVIAARTFSCHPEGGHSARDAAEDPSVNTEINLAPELMIVNQGNPLAWQGGRQFHHERAASWSYGAPVPRYSYNAPSIYTRPTMPPPMPHPSMMMHQRHDQRRDQPIRRH